MKVLPLIVVLAVQPVDIVKIIQLCPLNEQILWYVNYISVKL